MHRPDQGFEPAENVALIKRYCPDLDDFVVLRVEAGGLGIDSDVARWSLR